VEVLRSNVLLIVKTNIPSLVHFFPNTDHPAYGWSTGNFIRPIRIQQAGKILVSWCKVDKSGNALKSGTFLTGDGVRYPRKGIFNFKNHTSLQKLKSVNHFVFLNFYFGAKNARHGNSLVVRPVSQGRIIIVLFWTKYAIPRQFKPGILKLTASRGKRNLRTVFIFVSFEEKGCYRSVSLGHQNFDCRSYCGLSRRMQGMWWYSGDLILCLLH